MSGIDGKIVAVTAASSGMGEPTTLLLVDRGTAVVLGTRRPDPLSSLDKGRVFGSLAGFFLSVSVGHDLVVAERPSSFVTR